MKVLVTGGAGFIGSHLVDCYIKLGHEVLVVDDLSTGRREYVNPKARLIVKPLADIEVEELILSEKPDLINHHAAQVSVRKSVRDSLYDLDVNLRDTVKLLQIAGQAGVKKIIYASSGGTVYGDTPRIPVEETYRGIPISPYGINKLAAEDYLLFYAKQYGYNWTILRYANVYGPRQSPHGECGVISIFIDRIRGGHRPMVFGDGEQVRDYIHVTDVVSANLLVSEINEKWCDTFNVGVGYGTTLNQLLSLLGNISSCIVNPVYFPSKIGDLPWNVLSVEKLKSHGWNPMITLEQGVKDLFYE